MILYKSFLTNTFNSTISKYSYKSWPPNLFDLTLFFWLAQYFTVCGFLVDNGSKLFLIVLVTEACCYNVTSRYPS